MPLQPFQSGHADAILCRLLDPRLTATHPAEWLGSQFADRHEEVAGSGGYTWAGGAADSDMGWFEIYSAQFPAGNICLGGNGCTAEVDGNGGCSMYVVFVGPEDLEPNVPGKTLHHG